MFDIALELKSSFKKISFIEENHQYFFEGKEFMSVSALISKHTPFFKKEEISKKISQRESVTQEEVLMRWNVRRDFSTVKGTEFHFYVYKYLSENRRMKYETPIKKEVEQFHQFWDNKNKDRYDVIATELLVYDCAWEIAGTIDCILKNKMNGKYYIMDWKTNHMIRKYNIYEKMLEPINYLDNCEYNKYSIQTFLYKKIIEKNTGIKIEGNYLLHCSQNNENYEIINCEDMNKEVDLLLELRKQQLKS